jgi:hypothetical protein
MVPRRGKLNIIVHTMKHEAEAGAGIRPDDEAEDLGGMGVLSVGCYYTLSTEPR